MCANPAAPGRPWILHTTDEDVTEFASTPYAADAPRHVAAIRSPKGKLALYSNWRPGTIEVEPAGQEMEFYEYSGEEGRLELTPQQRAGSKLREELWATLEQATPQELQAPLPARLHGAHRQGMKNYLSYEERESVRADEAQEAHEREAHEREVPTPETREAPEARYPGESAAPGL